MIENIVYTVNAKTNTVDEWKLLAMMNGKDGKVCILEKDKKQCCLPARCVFFSEAEALKVASL